MNVGVVHSLWYSTDCTVSGGAAIRVSCRKERNALVWKVYSGSNFVPLGFGGSATNTVGE